jgi:hypothetical protein
MAFPMIPLAPLHIFDSSNPREEPVVLYPSPARSANAIRERYYQKLFGNDMFPPAPSLVDESLSSKLKRACSESSRACRDAFAGFRTMLSAGHFGGVLIRQRTDFKFAGTGLATLTDLGLGPRGVSFMVGVEGSALGNAVRAQAGISNQRPCLRVQHKFGIGNNTGASLVQTKSFFLFNKAEASQNLSLFTKGFGLGLWVVVDKSCKNFEFGFDVNLLGLTFMPGVDFNVDDESQFMQGFQAFRKAEQRQTEILGRLRTDLVHVRPH